MAVESWISQNSTVYFKNSHNSFSNLHGQPFVTVRNLLAWSGIPRYSIYQFLSRKSEVFIEFGVTCIDEVDSGRIQAAEAMGLKGYAQMTKSLYLFSPRSVVLFLLVADTRNGESFREFIGDWAADKRYCLPKLFVSLQQTGVKNEQIA